MADEVQAQVPGEIEAQVESELAEQVPSEVEAQAEDALTLRSTINSARKSNSRSRKNSTT